MVHLELLFILIGLVTEFYRFIITALGDTTRSEEYNIISFIYSVLALILLFTADFTIPLYVLFFIAILGNLLKPHFKKNKKYVITFNIIDSILSVGLIIWFAMENIHIQDLM